MENLERLTLIEMEEFVKSHRGLKIVAADGGRYAFIERVLRAQAYRRLKKTSKGTVRRFLAKVTGLSRAQITRLIARWQQTRRVMRSSAHGGTGRRMRRCWRPWTPLTKICPARRCDTSASGSSRFSEMRNTNGWRGSRHPHL